MLDGSHRNNGRGYDKEEDMLVNNKLGRMEDILEAKDDMLVDNMVEDTEDMWVDNKMVGLDGIVVVKDKFKSRLEEVNKDMKEDSISNCTPCI